MRLQARRDSRPMLLTTIWWHPIFWMDLFVPTSRRRRQISFRIGNKKRWLWALCCELVWNFLLAISRSARFFVTSLIALYLHQALSPWVVRSVTPGYAGFLILFPAARSLSSSVALPIPFIWSFPAVLAQISNFLLTELLSQHNKYGFIVRLCIVKAFFLLWSDTPWDKTNEGKILST